MASRHPRVQVSVDADVARAISSGRRLVGDDMPTSQVLRTLALRGAEALRVDREAEQAAQDVLVSVAQGTSGIDLDALRTTRDGAWR